MTVKQKKRAVNMYQLVVYTPQDPISRRLKDTLVYEIRGHIYPYREKEIPIDWFELFHPPEKRDYYPR